MPNSDQDARNDMPREADPSPPLPTAPTSPFPDPDAASSPGVAANDAAPPAPRTRTTRRRKAADQPAADVASLFDAPEAAATDDAQDGAPAPSRAAPRRRSARAAAPAAETPDSPAGQPEPTEAIAPEAAVPDATEPAVAAPDQPAAAAEAASPAPAGNTAVAVAPDAMQPEPRPTEPAPKAVPAGPPRPLVITPADAALAIVNPHPMRANDRPDSYLYHLTSPGEAKVLLQSGLTCSFDDPLILTERGGIPYWLSVLSEDVDDILDGPAAVTVLRVRRRSVQNAIESDADSSRAAQAPCYLLSGVSDLPPAPPAPPPPLLRARPAPVPAGEPAEPGAGVEMGGTVKWYNPRKGFGFITPGSGGKDVFVHASTLERAGLTQLTDGQTVRMQVIQGAKGPEAASLTLP
ncbi:MAG: cold shock domain-containing protein [Janthinobacterium lividum]